MNQRKLEILGILLVTVSSLVLISLLGYNSNEDPGISPNVNIENPLGILGLLIAYCFIKAGFGYVSFVLPILGIVWGIWFFTHKDFDHIARLSGYIIGGMVLSSISFGVGTFYAISGMIGGLIGTMFVDFLGRIGSGILLIALWLILIRGYFGFSFYEPIKELLIKIKKKQEEKKLISKEKSIENEKKLHTKNLISKIDEQRSKEGIVEAPVVNDKIDKPTEDSSFEDKIPIDSNDPDESNENLNIEKGSLDKDIENTNVESADKSFDPTSELKADDVSETDSKIDIEVGEIIEEAEIDLDQVEERKSPKKAYQLPTVDILENPSINIQSGMSKEELVDRANFLQQSLETFGVVGKVVNVSPGPVITLFEVEPAEGVRVNKFVALSDDLARVMEASRVRVIAPIPGKSSVGIEIPNRNPATVYFKSIINSPEFAESESMLTLAIGKTTSGEISTLDLSKMPHLLIAGTTGSGKSVCINTIICSILYHASPDEVKFVMIDPKKVEMTLYKSLEGYHLLKMEDIDEPIVTSVDNAILSLRALEKEMDRRYNVLAEAVVRNISEYNEKMQKTGEQIMPYIVLIVDELADLMMLSAKDVEAPIARLAQLARAVGIHLVIATQRPSVDVITGVIKANFPSRIAFQVASKIDSRTIIDQPGADKLIGRGDMLHLGTGSSDVFRMHNAFLTLEEIEALMGHITQQPKSESTALPSVRESLQNEYSGGDDASTDDLFNDAISLVVTHQQGSISLLQRRLKVGYSRAARLIDEMEQAGIVGPFTGSKAREVLVDESYLEIIKD